MRIDAMVVAMFLCLAIMAWQGEKTSQRKLDMQIIQMETQQCK